MSNETKKISEQMNRLKEISESLKNQQVEIDDVVSLVDETAKIKKDLEERFEAINKALEEREKDFS